MFLSHIHEEKELAITIKEALESEFAGFIDVFVSSDGVSIPAGSNFLKLIEDGLVNCLGALYLISPASVKRNWINFELGAVWARNIISIRTTGVSIPTIPICHSGMTIGALPQPINSLNGIQASSAAELSFAFSSLQASVGGKGPLRTDFDLLSKKITAFEVANTFGKSLKDFLDILRVDTAELVQACENSPDDPEVVIEIRVISQEKIDLLYRYEKEDLIGKVKLEITGSGVLFGPRGSQNEVTGTMKISSDTILSNKQALI